MSLGGNDIKPKNLTDAEKKEVFATKKGWVREAGSILSGNGNTSADPEVLVAISNLSANMGAANITEIEFVTTSFDKSDGGNIDVRLTFNEKVTVTGSPTIAITNSQAGGGSAASLTATYQSGSSSNKLVFRHTIGAGGSTVSADDVLSIASQNIALAGGTIKDTGTTVNSGVAVPAGTATMTAVA